MATHIMGADHGLLLPRPTDSCWGATYDAGCDARPEQSREIHQGDGSVFRGFFFAMLFNLFLLLVGAAGWEVWRVVR